MSELPHRADLGSDTADRSPTSETRLTILEVSDVDPAGSGGISKHARSLLNEWRSQPDVSVTSIRVGDFSELAGSSVVRPRFGRGLSKDHPLDALQVHLLNNVALASVCVSAADVVHVQDWRMVPAGVETGARLGAPVVLTLHTFPRRVLPSVGYNFESASPARESAREVLADLQDSALRSVDSVVCPSEALAGALRAHYGDDVVVHLIRGHFDDTDFVKTGPSNTDAKRVPGHAVFVGRFVNARDVALLVDAVDQLRDEGLFLTLLGDGPNRGSVEARIDKLGLRDRVLLAGDVSPSTVAATLATADVLLVPSRFDVYPTVIPEAQFSGVIPVAAAVGGIPEQIRENVDGVTFAVGSLAALVEAIRFALAHRETLRTSMAAGLPVLRELYSPRVAAQGYRRLFSSL